MQYGLTRNQLKCLKFIKNYIAKKTISPSYEEIKKAVGLKTKNSIHHYINRLEERGWLTRIRGKARSIRLKK